MSTATAVTEPRPILVAGIPSPLGQPPPATVVTLPAVSSFVHAESCGTVSSEQISPCVHRQCNGSTDVRCRSRPAGGETGPGSAFKNGTYDSLAVDLTNGPVTNVRDIQVSGAIDGYVAGVGELRGGCGNTIDSTDAVPFSRDRGNDSEVSTFRMRPLPVSAM